MSDEAVIRYSTSVRIFQLAVALPVIGLLVANASVRPSTLRHGELLFWIVAVAVTELLPVPIHGPVQLSLSFPILLATMVIYAPLTAATVAFLSAFDRRELRGTVQVATALFNRSQIALSVLAGGAVFHAMASPRDSILFVLPAVLAATVADFLVNITLVGFGMHLAMRTTILQAMRILRVGALPDFLLNYLGLSLIGLIIYRLYGLFSQHNGADAFLAIAVFIAPLIFARQMFFRTRALEVATKELQDRERVLRALSNRMAEERQDERLRIAEYLHDDLAQTLFQLTLRLEMAKKRLERGDLPGVNRDLDQIGEIKTRTSSMVRSLVRDLHAAPIGRTGLSDAIGSLAADLSTDHTEIRANVPQVSLPPPIQLLIYQIAREAVMNAMRHAEATHIWVSLKETGDGVDLQIRDDGVGFDISQAQPEGHFGTIMMRERALVAGGSFRIDSQPSRGTIITAHFPQVWIGEGDGRGSGAGSSHDPATPHQPETRADAHPPPESPAGSPIAPPSFPGEASTAP